MTSSWAPYFRVGWTNLKGWQGTSTLKIKICHDASFVVTVASEVVVITTSGFTSDDKYGMIVALGFQCMIIRMISRRCAWKSCSIPESHVASLHGKRSPHYWLLCEENNQSSVDYPHKGHLMFSLMFLWPNNLMAGDLRRHFEHVTVMYGTGFIQLHVRLSLHD